MDIKRDVLAFFDLINCFTADIVRDCYAYSNKNFAPSLLIYTDTMADCNKFNSKVPLFPLHILNFDLIRCFFGSDVTDHESIELTECERNDNDNEKQRLKVRKKKRKIKSNYHSFNISNAEWLTTYNASDTSPGASHVWKYHRNQINRYLPSAVVNTVSFSMNKY